MRKVKVAALQPAEITFPRQYRWGHDGYTPDVDAIMKHCILPQAEVTFGLLEEAGPAGIDIITTCEDIALANAYMIDTSDRNIFPEIVVRSFPILEERFSAIAKKHRMNIVACYYKQYEGQNYNIASVFNRNGEIIGEYRKTHLPSNELFQSAAGDSIHTIDTDIGRIGVLICYDMMFPAAAETLSLQGAEIVFHPTFGYGWFDSIGEATLRARASDGSFYIVTSKSYCYNAAGKSSVIDYWGHVMVDAGFTQNTYAMAEIDLDKPKAQPDWHIQTGITSQPNMRKRHEAERRPELYTAICEEKKEEFNIPSPGAEQAEFMEKVKSFTLHW